MLKRCHPFISVFLCAALIGTGGGGLEAAAFLRGASVFDSSRRCAFPRIVKSSTDPAFFTEQAIVERLISPINDSRVGDLYLHEGPGTAFGTQPGLAFYPPLRLLSWIFNAGKYGFQYSNELGHVFAAFLTFSLSPSRWGTLFTAANLRGNQSWTSYWRNGLLRDEPIATGDESHPYVDLPIRAKGPRDFIVRKGGFLLGLVPFAAIFWFGLCSSEAVSDPFRLSSLFLSFAVSLFLAGAVSPFFGALYSVVLSRNNTPGR